MRNSSPDHSPALTCVYPSPQIRNQTEASPPEPCPEAASPQETQIVTLVRRVLPTQTRRREGAQDNESARWRVCPEEQAGTFSVFMVDGARGDKCDLCLLNWGREVNQLFLLYERCEG